MVGDMVGNHVLQLCSQVAVKLNFRLNLYIYTSPNENIEYSFPIIVTGGEGCNIASGGAVIGLGSDIGGSIRMPAFFNGIYGHRPSKGK